MSVTEDFGGRWLQAQVDVVERRLQGEFGDHVPAERVTEVVARALDRFRDAPVRNFLPMLISRNARSELRAHVQHHRQVA